MVLLLCLFLLFVLKCPHQILSFACHFGRSSAAGLVIRRLFYLISFRNPPLIICLLAPPGIVTYIFRRATPSATTVNLNATALTSSEGFTTMPWKACAAIRRWPPSTPVKLRSTGWNATAWKAAFTRSAVTDFSHPAQNEGR